MKTFQKITESYPKWSPNDLAFIKSIVWVKSRLEVSFYSQLRYQAGRWPDLTRPFFEVTIKFDTVSDLEIRLSVSTAEIIQISGLEIQDITDSQWENVNFEIFEYEGDRLKFRCSGIEVVSISEEMYLSTTG